MVLFSFYSTGCDTGIGMPAAYTYNGERSNNAQIAAARNNNRNSAIMYPRIRTPGLSLLTRGNLCRKPR